MKIEIEIECATKDSDVMGLEEYLVTRACIDLDKASCIWEDPNGEAVIIIGKDQFRTKTYSYDELVAMWNNETISVNKAVSNICG